MNRIFSLHSTTTMLAAAFCGAGLLPALAADAGKSASSPDLMAGGMGWNSIGGQNGRVGNDFIPVPGSPEPVTYDLAYPYVPNNVGKQPTWRVADLSNPNLTQWAKDELKKDNDRIAAGFAMYNRTSRCWEPGVPVLNTSPGRTYFLQTPKEVMILWQRDQIVRHVYLDVPHSKSPKPSWNGESIGHYDGDTLVVDTIGLSTKSFVDNYRTPHSNNLHVVERFRLIDGGKRLEVEMTIDDPAAFVKPWKALHRWGIDRTQAENPGNVTGTYDEEIRCMDGEMVNPLNQIESALLEPLPVALRKDF
jgi:hypothetical protein